MESDNSPANDDHADHNVQVEINSKNKGHDGYGLTSQRDFDGFLSLADTLMEGLHIGPLLGSQVIEDEGLFKFT
jgi:hypothetical protein